MAVFCAKWELISSDENFEEYMKAVCVTPEKLELAKKNLVGGAKVFQEISKNGTTWTVKVITVAGDKVDTYPEGKETKALTLDGRMVKVVYSLEGEELVEFQTGDGFTSRNVRRVSGDQMTMTFTANGSISSSRVYKRVS
ncbi:fatty acid-binding protein [Plakobranchus ocellatus]|uniref:Fatty acid-binding protein n=1 Tax=Plakobranchus ocellatus TaxID=259542 RepID=A0AAV4BR88_9GAST|nr:fatty acid-binding protein [Plakobranchus ocellatus]